MAMEFGSWGLYRMGKEYCHSITEFLLLKIALGVTFNPQGFLDLFLRIILQTRPHIESQFIMSRVVFVEVKIKRVQDLLAGSPPLPFSGITWVLTLNLRAVIYNLKTTGLVTFVHWTVKDTGLGMG